MAGLPVAGPLIMGVALLAFAALGTRTHPVPAPLVVLVFAAAAGTRSATARGPIA